MKSSRPLFWTLLIGAAFGLIVAVCIPLLAQQQGQVAKTGFDRHFTGDTLRFDYFHSGNAAEGHISPDEFRVEGAWAGSRTWLTDDARIGHYLFEVTRPNGTVIYSHSFSSIFGEWQTTGEAKKIWRTFHESQRFPEPKGAFGMRLHHRGDDGKLHLFYETAVDPSQTIFNRTEPTSSAQPFAILESGDPSTKVDLLVLGDGYSAAESDKFQRDSKRLIGDLFAVEPFKSRKAQFNVRGLAVPSAKSGIRDPRRAIWRQNPLGLSFNSFGSDRYVLTYRNKALREHAAVSPYDALVIIFNGRKYGGGGIYNLWATSPADSSVADYVFVHEFGHSFAGLADEYYTSSVSYEDFTPPGVEPAEPNVTALLDPANIKWKHLLTDDIPLPTPWGKERYDSTSRAFQKTRGGIIDSDLEPSAKDDALESLFDEVKTVSTQMLGNEKHFGKVGAFEGAAYEAKGLYRPAADCLMFTRNKQEFCPVCHEAVGEAIDRFTQPKP